MLDVSDTIVALASAPGMGLRGIVRVSGPGTVNCLERLFCATVPSGDNARISDVGSPSVISGQLDLAPPTGSLPCNLYLWPTSRSYTRQPSAELHTFGSPPLLDEVIHTLCRHGARPAQPGEFTMRAFLAGRLDLTQAEAVLGVIDARDRRQLDTALTQLAGGLAGPLNQLRDQLLDLLAHLEAGLDFVEEDIEFISSDALRDQLQFTADRLAGIVSQMDTRAEQNDELQVVLMGAPNAGKSSLLNALVGQSAAIVSNLAGTTRDYVSQHAEFGGLRCLFIDTAGVENERPVDPLAAVSQSAAANQHLAADLRLFCIDSTRVLNQWEVEQLAGSAKAEQIIVLTKSDLPLLTDYTGDSIATSSQTRQGLEQLRDAIIQFAETHGDYVPATTARCKDSLTRAADSLRRAQILASQEEGQELVAAELRAVLSDLGQVVGTVYTDDILDRVFSRFCIGK